uniref:Uncharacterized protein n=1 Tax=Oryza glumipatula TaxID=40148 RepID=A0A0E0AXC6_9ORYZ
MVGKNEVKKKRNSQCTDAGSDSGGRAVKIGTGSEGLSMSPPMEWGIWNEGVEKPPRRRRLDKRPYYLLRIVSTSTSVHTMKLTNATECVNLPGGFDCLCFDGTEGNPRKKGGCLPVKHYLLEFWVCTSGLWLVVPQLFCSSQLVLPSY